MTIDEAYDLSEYVDERVKDLEHRTERVMSDKRCCIPHVEFMSDMVDKTPKIINNVVDEIIRYEKEHTEKTLAEIITKYDFIVGSKEVKFKLMEVLPEEATIISSPYIKSPNLIYAIKKFDATDLLT